MIQAVVVTNPSKDTYRFPLEHPESSGICITGIDGLGPVKVSHFNQSVYNLDGVLHTGSRAEFRTITVSTRLISSTPQNARRLLYRAFPPKQKIQFSVETSHQTFTIVGYVESVTPNIFSAEESLQITIVCPHPYWYTPNRWSDGGVEIAEEAGGFTFPFGTPPNVTFGSTVRVTRKIIEYTGDANTGALFLFAMVKNPGTLTVANHTMGTAWSMDFNIYKRVMGRDPIAGSTFEIDSRREALYAAMWESGKRVQCTGMVAFGSVWPELQPGPNDIEFTTTYGTPLTVFSSISVMYAPLFLGV